MLGGDVLSSHCVRRGCIVFPLCEAGMYCVPIV